MLDLIDAFGRECPAIRVGRKLGSTDIIDVLADQFIMRDVPCHIRSHNGPAEVAIAMRSRTAAVGARTACIEPGGPWKNGFCESFNSGPRDERLAGEIFASLAETRVVIESWRQHDDTRRPRSASGCRPAAPEAVQWPTPPPGAAPPDTPSMASRPAMLQDRTRTTR